MPRFDVPLAALLLAAAPAARAQAGSLEVKVTDEAGAPLAGVVAKVDGVARGRTGVDGRVKVGGLAAGWHALKLARDGRVGLGLGMLLPAGGIAAVEVGLPRARASAIPLPRLNVVARKDGELGDRAHGGRGAGGTGRRWSGGDILRRKPGRLTDVLRDAPEVELVEGANGTVLRFRRAFAAREGSPGQAGLAPPDCAPAYYVDGVRFEGLETPDVFPPAEVDEVVLYAGNVPPAYGGMRASCGAVVIRTRGTPAADDKPRARPSYLRPGAPKPVVPPNPGKSARPTAKLPQARP
ncbi:MAG TPA: hypothetical protein VGO40_05270 [Longimicrobium sp.]|jgi:hypothetical protein|nr:hypothetical protein [Longimicrobium sp.]